MTTQIGTTQAALRLVDALKRRQAEKVAADLEMRTRVHYGVTVSFKPDPLDIEIRAALAECLGVAPDDVRVTVY